MMDVGRMSTSRSAGVVHTTTGGATVKDQVTQMAETGDDIRERLDVDVVNVGPHPPSHAGLARDLGIEEGHHRLIDEFGIGWQMPVDGGRYHDLYLSPLARAETDWAFVRYDVQRAIRIPSEVAECFTVVPDD